MAKLMAIVVSACLFGVLFWDALNSIFAPWPHRIGEGMMLWMASRLSEWQLPYGDIFAVPSVYACYGPLPSLLASIVGSVLMDPENPASMLFAGRAMVFVCWVWASCCVSLTVRPNKTHPLVSSVVLLAIVSPFWVFYTFRVDAFAIAILSAILASMVRLEGKPLVVALSVFAACLAMTKPTAALDIFPMILMASAIRETPLWQEIRRLTKPMLIASLVALSFVIAVELMSGRWMLNNIIFTQSISGITTHEIYRACVDFAVYGRQNVIIWLGLAALLLSGNSAKSVLAVSLSLAICGLLATKDGADYNYYMPAILLATVATVRELDRLGRLNMAILILPLSILPLDGALHRTSKPEISRQTSNKALIIEAHRSPDFLSDDPYYSVLAGSQPLATDLFQLSRALASANRDASELVSSARGAWGEEYLWVILNRQITSEDAFAMPMPYGNSWGGIRVDSLTSVIPSRPPEIVRPASLRWDYYSLILLPSLTLAILALLSSSPSPLKRGVGK